MTSKGAFQPKAFYDSMIQKSDLSVINNLKKPTHVYNVIKKDDVKQP